MLKKIAFYLPQFHSIPENDRWWGDGFTEWTNVKNSKPQFRGHIQPEQPLNDNYYNLLEEDVQEWQSNLALKNSIDGFCYYHYWFEGKMLLEKPMENMLNNKNIRIPFCICWANESWSRTWDGRDTEVLIEQNYNEDEKQWEEHFNYLFKFFEDERYIRHHGAPMLLIYKPQLITRCKEMISYWRKLACDRGLSGLYIGYQHFSAFEYDMKQMGFDFGVQFEPFYTVNQIKKKNNNMINKIEWIIKNPSEIGRFVKRKLFNTPKIYDYDSIWREIIDRKIADYVYPGAFPSWDNTPRRGKKSDVFYKATPKKFNKYWNELLKKSCNENVEYIFINAWNEWAEGAHLEPDAENGTGYLDAIRGKNAN